MLTHIPLGPAVVPAYPFLILIGLWMGMSVAARVAERMPEGRRFEGDHIYNMGLYSFVVGLLGGRAWYVITHWSAYVSDLREALSLTANAIDGWAVTVCAVMTVLIYSRRHQLPIPNVADAIAFGASVTLIVAGVGAFLGSQTLGALTDVPWAVSLYGELRHPAHLYLVLSVIMILVVLWRLNASPRRAGFLALLFITLYASSRLIFDPFFAAPQTIGLGLRLVQVLALLAIVAALILMMWLETKPKSSVPRGELLPEG
ncbi:MAG: prolipoprotein diacylglyceryl transferase family protein [Chloroflexota bacterium]